MTIDLASASSTQVHVYHAETLLHLSLPLGETDRVVAELAGHGWPVANNDPSDKAPNARRLTLDPRQAPRVERPNSTQALTIAVTPAGFFGPLNRMVYQVSVLLPPVPRC